MKTEPIDITVKVSESQVAALQELCASEIKTIVVTITFENGNSQKYAMYAAEEIKNATENALLLFFMRDGNIYEGYLKRVEEEDNMIVVKSIEEKFVFGLYLSCIFGWIDMNQPIKED